MGGKQAVQRKEEVNRRVLKELLPIHCIKKKIFSQLSGFPFFKKTSYSKVGAQNARKIPC